MKHYSMFYRLLLFGCLKCNCLKTKDLKENYLMESVILVGSLLLVVFLVYVFFFKKNGEIEKKSYYLKRFLRNKEQSLRHIKEVESLVVLNDVWSSKAFPNKELIFSEYLDRLKTKYEKDYSDSSYKILKRNKLSHSQKQEYTKQLMEQSEDLYLMEVDLGILNKTWKKSVS